MVAKAIVARKTVGRVERPWGSNPYSSAKTLGNSVTVARCFKTLSVLNANSNIDLALGAASGGSTPSSPTNKETYSKFSRTRLLI